MKTEPIRRFIILIVIAFLAPLVVLNNAAAQAKKPITKEGLLEALRIGGLSARALVQEIKSRGVSFELSGSTESELRAAGARPAVIDAARANYRPLLGRLVVVSSQSGAEIIIKGVGVYTDSMRLPPGNYTIVGSKFGFRQITNEVLIKLFETSTVNLRFVPLTLEEMLTTAAQSYEQGNFVTAIAVTRHILATQPNNARALSLTASSLYATGDYDNAVLSFMKVLQSGEAVSLSILHRHGGNWGGKTLCAGRITFRKDVMEFYSKDFADEGFVIPYSKIVEMSVKDQIRLSLKVRIKLPKNRKESDEEYNYYSTDAVATGRIVTCEQCLPRMRAVLELLRQLRSGI